MRCCLKKRPDLIGFNGATEAFTAYVTIADNAGEHYYATFGTADTVGVYQFTIVNRGGEWKTIDLVDRYTKSDFEAMIK